MSHGSRLSNLAVTPPYLCTSSFNFVTWCGDFGLAAIWVISGRHWSGCSEPLMRTWTQNSWRGLASVEQTGSPPSVPSLSPPLRWAAWSGVHHTGPALCRQWCSIAGSRSSTSSEAVTLLLCGQLNIPGALWRLRMSEKFYQKAPLGLPINLNIHMFTVGSESILLLCVTCTFGFFFDSFLSPLNWPLLFWAWCLQYPSSQCFMVDTYGNWPKSLRTPWHKPLR